MRCVTGDLMPSCLYSEEISFELMYLAGACLVPTLMAWRTILAMLLTAVVGWVSPSAVANEVIVYSARSHYDQEPAFEAFTKQTGIVMKTFGGNAL